jgi:hypothetical protein
MKTKQMLFWLMLTVLTMGIGMSLTAPAQADNPLPPRETPTPVPADRHKSSRSKPVGAYIELVAPGAPAGAWATVQWQDSAGGWQDVTGWQGPAANSRWWVAAKDFGTGPFRWRVAQGPGGVEWGVSGPFHLPAGGNQILRVTAGPAL